MNEKNFDALSKSEILNMILQCKKELMNLRFQKNSGSLSDTSLLSKIKKKCARLLTSLNNKTSKD